MTARLSSRMLLTGGGGHQRLSGLPGMALLVVAGGGYALLTAAEPYVGVGMSGMALAFGLTMMVMAPAGGPGNRFLYRAMAGTLRARVPGWLTRVFVVCCLVYGLTGNGAETFRWSLPSGLVPALTETGLTALFVLAASGRGWGAMVVALAGMFPLVAGFVLTLLWLSGEPAPTATQGLSGGMLWFWWLMPVAGGMAGRRVAHCLLHYGHGMSG